MELDDLIREASIMQNIENHEYLARNEISMDAKMYFALNQLYLKNRKTSSKTL